MRFKRLIQPLRLCVQACFMAGLILPLFPYSESYAKSKVILVSVIFFGVFFCGWICPFGAAQDWIAWLGRKIKIPRFQMPRKMQNYLQFSRYILTFIGFWGISFSFLNTRYYFNHNLMNNMLTMYSGISLATFLIVSLFFDRPFCNYFCMKGAVDGMISVLRPVSIKKDDKLSVHCHLCDKVCPMNIPVERMNFVRHPNCINCMRCVSMCPKSCLKYQLMKIKKG